MINTRREGHKFGLHTDVDMCQRAKSVEAFGLSLTRSKSGSRRIVGGKGWPEPDTADVGVEKDRRWGRVA